ncbi:MAG: HEPN domain-containing protein, partial [Candidatus Parcubacteria bacterium]|nr:HEPN domain-containing protein [Candidatus Parcubacteria bacterium]
MASYIDLKRIALSRLKESKVLFKAGFYDGSVYLGGYVLEVALKALICKHLRINQYPDEGRNKDLFSCHDFDRLLLLSGLSKRINTNNKKNKELFRNWSTLTQWRSEGRYTAIGTYKKQYVNDFFKALEDKKYGLFTFIKKIINKVKKVKGDVILFMLWKDIADFDKWSVIISADWIDNTNSREAFDYWLNLLQKNL